MSMSYKGLDHLFKRQIRSSTVSCLIAAGYLIILRESARILGFKLRAMRLSIKCRPVSMRLRRIRISVGVTALMGLMRGRIAVSAMAV